VITDISLGVPMWHVFSESLIVLVSGFGALFLVKDIRSRILNTVRLKQELVFSDEKLRNISQAMKNARHADRHIIHNQFEQWHLTLSEQEIAMLLLKGLSFKEISSVRNTKDKTFRQQASVIYSKANIEGHHDFSAWFLDNFMA